MQGAQPILAAAALWFLAAGAAGCAAPGPVVRLDAIGSSITWMRGHASLTKEAGGVKAVAGFHHQEGDQLVLHVMVENRGAEALDANPRDMSYTACTTEQLASCAPARYAVDPEAILASLELERSRQAADAGGAEAATTALLLLAAVADIGTIASGRASPTTGLATAGAVALHETVKGEHERASAELGAAEQRWSEQLFRRTTLAPGGYVDGWVYLPIDLDASRVWFHVRAGGQVLSFPFQQTVKRPLTGPETPEDFRDRRRNGP
jgi:hypothetical protein